MSGLLHKATFGDYSSAILAVDCWALEADRDGRARRDLFAVIDAEDPAAVVATLATRAYCYMTADLLRKLLDETRGLDGLRVLSVRSGDRCNLNTIDELIGAVRKLQAQEGAFLNGR